MSYESICARNKQMYGELEALTLKINEIGERYYDQKYSILTARKESIKAKIAYNLECLEVIWARYPNGLPAKRITERSYYKRVAAMVARYPDAPPAIIAGLSRVVTKTCIKVINQMQNQ